METRISNQLPVWLVLPFLVLAAMVLLLLSGSAFVAFPESPVAVFDASPRLEQLNLAVHAHIRFEQHAKAGVQHPATTLTRAAGTAQEQTLLLLALTHQYLGVEPRLALIRLKPSGERRVVMEWRDLYYDPGLAVVYGPGQVSGVVRVLSYGAALAEATL